MLAKLRPQMIEHESLEEELKELRAERWRFEQVRELEQLKEMVIAGNSNSQNQSRENLANRALEHAALTITVATGAAEQAEEALQEMVDLEKELDAEMELLRLQFATAKESESTFRIAKQKLLDEMNEFMIDESDGMTIIEKDYDSVSSDKAYM